MFSLRNILVLYLLIASSGVPVPMVHDHDMMADDHSLVSVEHHNETFHRTSETLPGSELHFHWVFAFGTAHQTEQGAHAEEAIRVTSSQEITITGQFISSLDDSLQSGLHCGIIVPVCCNLDSVFAIGLCEAWSSQASSSSLPLALRC